MAAGEDQAQAVVYCAIGLTSVPASVPALVRVLVCPLARHGDDPLVEHGAAAQVVDRLEAAGAHEPGTRMRRHAGSRPLLERGDEGIVKRLFGDVEVTEEADQRG